VHFVAGDPLVRVLASVMLRRKEERKEEKGDCWLFEVSILPKHRGLSDFEYLKRWCRFVSGNGEEDATQGDDVLQILVD
jgi:hypothetical protein